MIEIEIILVDDGSPDNCPQMCDQFAAEDARICAIHQKNAGVSAARNRGMEVASAQWIMFVDPDDWLELDAVQVLFDKAVETDCDIVCASFYKNTPSKQTSVSPSNSATEIYCVDQQMSFLLGCAIQAEKDDFHNCLGAPWGKIYRADKLKNGGVVFPQGLKRSQDLIFNLYAVRSVQKVCFFDVALYHYWTRTRTAVRLFADHQEISHRFHKEVCIFMEKFQLQEELQNYFYCRAAINAISLSALYGYAVNSVHSFKTNTLLLRQFCNDHICNEAIVKTRFSAMPRKGQVLSLWFLKRHMYRTTILLHFIYGKLFPYK